MKHDYSSTFISHVQTLDTEDSIALKDVNIRRAQLHTARLRNWL